MKLNPKMHTIDSPRGTGRTSRPNRKVQANRKKRARKLLLSIAASVVVLVGLGLVLYLTVIVPRKAPAGPSVRVDPVAQDFDLTDQRGGAFHLADFRGKPVVVAFLSTRSTGSDQYIALKLRSAARALQEQVSNVVFIAVTTDPGHDTAAVRLDYSQKTGLDSYWRFLSGDSKKLHELYAAFDVGASDLGPAGAKATTASKGTEAKAAGTYDPNKLAPADAPVEGLDAQDRILAIMLDQYFGKAPSGTPYPIIWLIDKNGRYATPLGVTDTPVQMATAIMSAIKG